MKFLFVFFLFLHPYAIKARVVESSLSKDILFLVNGQPTDKQIHFQLIVPSILRNKLKRQDSMEEPGITGQPVMQASAEALFSIQEPSDERLTEEEMFSIIRWWTLFTFALAIMCIVLFAKLRKYPRKIKSVS